MKELSAKYRSVTAYEVQRDALMTASYSPDGRVCQMVIEKRLATKAANKTSVDLDPFFSPEKVKQVVDELAPPTVRGKELTDFKHWLGTDIVGNSVITTRTYRNVTVETYGSISDSEIKTMFRPTGPKHDKQAKPEARSVLVVVIKWRNACQNQPAPSSPGRVPGPPGR